MRIFLYMALLGTLASGQVLAAPLKQRRYTLPRADRRRPHDAS